MITNISKFSYISEMEQGLNIILNDIGIDSIYSESGSSDISIGENLKKIFNYTSKCISNIVSTFGLYIKKISSRYDKYKTGKRLQGVYTIYRDELINGAKKALDEEKNNKNNTLRLKNIIIENDIEEPFNGFIKSWPKEFSNRLSGKLKEMKKFSITQDEYSSNIVLQAISDSLSSIGYLNESLFIPRLKSKIIEYQEGMPDSNEILEFIESVLNDTTISETIGFSNICKTFLGEKIKNPEDIVDKLKSHEEKSIKDYYDFCSKIETSTLKACEDAKNKLNIFRNNINDLQNDKLIISIYSKACARIYKSIEKYILVSECILSIYSKYNGTISSKCQEFAEMLIKY